MNLFVPGGITAATLAAAWHFAPRPNDPAYPVPIEAAEARLEAMTFEEGMLTGLHFSIAVEGDSAERRLRWDFRERAGAASASSCTVALRPAVPDSTEAAVDCAVRARSDDPTLAVDAAKLMKLMKLIMFEHVDSTLKGRPFDHSSMGNKLIAFAVANRASLARRAEIRFREAENRGTE